MLLLRNGFRGWEEAYPDRVIREHTAAAHGRSWREDGGRRRPDLYAYGGYSAANRGQPVVVRLP